MDELCKNGGTDRDAVWSLEGQTRVHPRNHVLISSGCRVAPPGEYDSAIGLLRFSGRFC